MPFTYLIGWSSLNKWYYGVRWSKRADPSQFWSQYNTSSRYVKKFIEQHGQPDILEVRRIFEGSDAARAYETGVLVRLNRRDPFGQNSKWLNRTTNKSIHNAQAYVRTDEMREALRQKKLQNPSSPETCAKISKALTGRKQSPETCAKKSVALKGKKKSKEHIEKALANRTESRYWLGKTRSDDTKLKLSIKRKGKTIDQLVAPDKIQGLKEKLSEGSSKEWIIVFPDGHEETIINLKNFCIQNNLTLECMYGIVRGDQKTHKGFSVRRA